MINRQWLNTFLVLAEEGHFTRTAERLHMTQPGVSQQLQKLEAQLGVQLLNREGRQFELTSAGEKLLHWGGQQQREEQQLLRNLVADEPDQGECRIACSGAMALQLYPGFLQHQMAHPGLTLALEAAPHQSILMQLETGRIDLGLVTLTQVPAQFEASCVGAQQLCLVLPAALPWQQPTLAALNELGFIDHPDGAHYAQLLFEHWLDGFSGSDRLARRGYINQISQILLPVARGLGYTVLPMSVVEAFPERGRLRIAPLPVEVCEPVYLIQRKYHPLPARYQWFCEEISRVLRAEKQSDG